MSAPAPRMVAIDALRAGAVALVLLSHARALVVQDAGGGPAPSWPAAVFLAVSGLGHQAVIVFFVLSGLVVTEAMLRLHAAGRWSLGRFATARLVRLWIVLAPCLVLGALLDRFGLALAGPGLPYGIPPLAARALAVPALDLATTFGNLVFLQTVAVPVLGSNGPLWSLANEFWYYVIAALAVSAWVARPTPARAAAPAVAACLVLAALPVSMMALAPVWAAGALVAGLRRHVGLHHWQRAFSGGCGGAAAILLLILARLHRGPGPLAADLALGIAVAAMLLGLPASGAAPIGRVAATVRRAAEASYSLYLSHLPVLSVLTVLLVGPERLPLGPRAFLLLGLELLAALAVAAAVWWAFERHTPRLQAWLVAKRLRPRAAAFAVSEVA